MTPDDFDRARMFEYPINHDERKRRQGQLARTSNAAHPAQIGECRKGSGALMDILGDALRGCRAFLSDVVDDAFEVVRRSWGPANLHLRGEPRALADFLRREELPGVQLLQTLVNLPPEPRVVVKVVFDKLLHVLRGAAAVLFGGSVEFRLRLRAEFYFHCL